MAHVLILLAGYPATGKSTFCRALVKRHPDVTILAPDDIKERIWDEYGFDGPEEKAALDQMASAEYAQLMEDAMARGESVVGDYPFSDKQYAMLKRLSEKYGYQVITVRFVGDLVEIYKRSLARDLNPSRHLGHLVNHYHKGDVLEDRTKAEALVTFDTLKYRCETKGYGSFQLGDLVEVDTTDITKVDHEQIIDDIEHYLGKDF